MSLFELLFWICFCYRLHFSSPSCIPCYCIDVKEIHNPTLPANLAKPS
jgi:hypothetical protein